MSKFLSPLIVRELDDDQWMLTCDLFYQSDIFADTIKVPCDFVTDFASVPRIPLAFWLCGDTAHAAATVHDYLYQTHLRDRKTCDDILDEAMIVTDIAEWRRSLIYLGVRIGGWLAYKNGLKRHALLGNSLRFQKYR